jgi:hypothetical protein
VDLEEMFMGHCNISQALFIDLVIFKRICMTLFKSLVEGTYIFQFLTFTGVSQKSLDEIDRIYKKRRGCVVFARKDEVGYHI